MSEIKSQKKQKSKQKNNSAEKLLEKGIHPILLFYGMFFTIVVLYSSLVLNRLPIILSLFILSISSFLTYYNFYGRKVVVTTHKIYFYRLGKKTITLSFAKDFLHMKYEKTRLGRILDYGTILLVTQEEKYYKIHFVTNPEEVFYTSIEAYENIMSMINPDYEKKFTKKDSEIQKQNFEKIED